LFKDLLVPAGFIVKYMQLITIQRGIEELQAI
jgi:hypothetical protein